MIPGSKEEKEKKERKKQCDYSQLMIMETWACPIVLVSPTVPDPIAVSQGLQAGQGYTGCMEMSVSKAEAPFPWAARARAGVGLQGSQSAQGSGVWLLPHPIPWSTRGTGQCKGELSGRSSSTLSSSDGCIRPALPNKRPPRARAMRWLWQALMQPGCCLHCWQCG